MSKVDYYKCDNCGEPIFEFNWSDLCCADYHFCCMKCKKSYHKELKKQGDGE